MIYIYVYISYFLKRHFQFKCPRPHPGANCHGFCGFPSIDWHVVPSYIHPSCFGTTDVHRIGFPGPKSGRLESQCTIFYTTRIRAWREGYQPFFTGWWKCIALPCTYFDMHESQWSLGNVWLRPVGAPVSNTAH